MKVTKTEEQIFYLSPGTKEHGFGGQNPSSKLNMCSSVYFLVYRGQRQAFNDQKSLPLSEHEMYNILTKTLLIPLPSNMAMRPVNEQNPRTCHHCNIFY